MSFDELLLDDQEALQRRDEGRLLWNLATAGAQVRRAVELRAEFGLDQLVGQQPRALLVATDAPSATVARVLARVSCESVPALAWHGSELPRWAGAADALLVASLDGRHPGLAELTARAVHRGLNLAVAAPADSPVAAAAGRAPVHPVPADLHPQAGLWAVLAPLLQAVDALGLHSVPDRLLGQIADAVDDVAEACRPAGELFTNPAKALAAEFAETRPVLAGAGPLAAVAAGCMAEALQLAAGAAAVAVSLPDGVARAGALLRGDRPPAGGDPDDFFRDRVEDTGARRARLLIMGDDGVAGDVAPRPDTAGPGAQLDEVAARRAAAALRRVADELGVRASGVDVPDGPVLARFAAATAFGAFTAAYLALGLGFDPGAPRPAEPAR